MSLCVLPSQSQEKGSWEYNAILNVPPNSYSNHLLSILCTNDSVNQILWFVRKYVVYNVLQPLTTEAFCLATKYSITRYLLQFWHVFITKDMTINAKCHTKASTWLCSTFTIHKFYCGNIVYNNSWSTYL